MEDATYTSQATIFVTFLDGGREVRALLLSNEVPTTIRQALCVSRELRQYTMDLSAFQDNIEHRRVDSVVSTESLDCRIKLQKKEPKGKI
jgi:hypothetical protein